MDFQEVLGMVEQEVLETRDFSLGFLKLFFHVAAWKIRIFLHKTGENEHFPPAGGKNSLGRKMPKWESTHFPPTSH